MRSSRLVFAAVGSAALATAQVAGLSTAVAAERLPPLTVDLGQTTVSGLSSGAFMAVQFHVAFSGTVRGAGVVAGGPYYCAEGQLFTNALNKCMQTGLGTPDPDRLLGIARGFAQDGRIDPLQNLASHRAYLFAGTNDQTVTRPVVDAARRFYLAAGLPAAGLTYRDDVPAGHAMVTVSVGNACSRTAPPFINDCDLDLAGAILRQLYPDLGPAASAQPGGKVIAFDQTEFFRTGVESARVPAPGPAPGVRLGPASIPMSPQPPAPMGAATGFPGAPVTMTLPPPGAFPASPPPQPFAPEAPPANLAFTWGWPWAWPWLWPWTPAFPTAPGAALGLNDTGLAYVPAACSAGGQPCRVHVVFHGCKQTMDDIQEQYARNTGYNRWADTNRIVVLYPQARSEPQTNPNGCWDWWGYTGAAYATKDGPQMAAVRAMLDRLAER